MSFIPYKNYNELNIFYPYDSDFELNYTIFIGSTGKDSGYFCYYSYILSKYIMAKTFTPFTIKDSEDRVWNFIPGYRPQFEARIGSEYLYMYYLDSNMYVSNTLYKRPLKYYVYNKGLEEDENGFLHSQKDTDYFKGNTINFKNGITFTGYGKYEGQSFTVNVYRTAPIWVNNNSSRSKPFGIYEPYQDNTEPARYLGNRYWTDENKKEYIMSTDKYYTDPNYQRGAQHYYISNIEYQYSETTKTHRWIIWGDDTKSWGWENNLEKPLFSQNYTYQAFGKTGISNKTLTFAGYTWGYQKVPYYYFDFARVY